MSRYAYYWAAGDFETFAKTADSLKRDLRFKHFCSYCLLREQDREEKRKIASVLLNIRFTSNVIRLIPQPLWSDFLSPVIIEWNGEDPLNPEPYKWLGIFYFEIKPAPPKVAYLLKAYELNPKDLDVLNHLILDLLNEVEYATHHIFESSHEGNTLASKLLFEESQVLRFLSEAESLIQQLPEGRRPYWSEEIAYYREMMEYWETYKKNPCKMTFGQWCKDMGKEYSWPNVIYY